MGDVNRTESSTTVRALRFTTANGLKFQTDGQLLTNDGRQRGALKTLIDVETPAALAMLSIQLAETWQKTAAKHKVDTTPKSTAGYELSTADVEGWLK